MKGIYVTSNSTQGDKIDQWIKYVKDAKLNAMVIDVKDDEGNVTMKFNTGNKLIDKILWILQMLNHYWKVKR